MPSPISRSNNSSFDYFLFRLRALAREGPAGVLGLVRNLTIALDLEFYETWTWSLEHQHQETERKEGEVHSFSRILLATASELHSLSFVMRTTEDSLGSAWSLFSRRGIGAGLFGGPVIAAMTQQATAAPMFLHLTELTLDATADVAPILSHTPCLTSLRLRISDGFNAVESQSILHSLSCVPKLQELEMWTSTLGSETTKSLIEIGRSCPMLRRLYLQSRTYDDADGGMGLRVVSEKDFDWKVCSTRYILAAVGP